MTPSTNVPDGPTTEVVGFERTLQQAFELWFNPELERRRVAGLLGPDFKLMKAQVLFSDNGPALVRINDEVRGDFLVRVARAVKKGDPVFEQDIASFEGVALSESDRDFGHFTIIRYGNGWQVLFDFRRNKQHALDLISRAEEFIAVSEFCLSKDLKAAHVDNLFSAYELLAKAHLVTSILPKDTKSHGRIHAVLNLSRRLGNIEHNFVDEFNKLTAARVKARYKGEQISEFVFSTNALEIARGAIERLRERYFLKLPASDK